MLVDYYKLLGIHPGSPPEIVKQALDDKLNELKKSLSKNNSSVIDDIKSLNKIYDILLNEEQRIAYDQKLLDRVAMKTNFISSNLKPQIVFLKVDEQFSKLNNEITISWKTINADQVILLPFGPVEYEGVKKLDTKTYENTLTEIKLLAENTVNGLKCSKAILLNNDEYNDRYQDYRKRKQLRQNLSEQIKTSKVIIKHDIGIKKYFYFKNILIAISLILIISYFVKCN